ncbi:MAG: flagellar basal body P-ring formation chaperone FlgA [Rhodocyclaceae bacterium]|nr:flagellar basal body P-ring formation chaperone FlgA [Rhodocyclaceae bacterium]
MKLPFILVALLISQAVAAHQEPAAVKKAVEEYLRIQTKGLPGQISYTVSGLDPNNNLPPCAAFEVSQSPGSRAWGRTSVKVRCAQDGGWSVFVPVHIKVVANYLIAARPLAQGQIITEPDFGLQSGDLSDLPSGILTDPRQAVGRTATMPVPAGRPLRSDMLRQAMVIQQGQNVKVVSRGPGFEVSNDGKALNNAAEGQIAQVRLNSGQIVSGVARAGGQVEVGY